MEGIWLLCARGGKKGKKGVKEGGAYAVMRELHLAVEDEGVRSVVERVVEVLMSGEEGNQQVLKDETEGRAIELSEELGERGGGAMVREDEDSDDERVVEIF